jgi:hypothetical protein
MMVSEFEWLSGAASPVVDHPAFGLLRGTPSRNGAWLWQSLDLVDTPRGNADIAFEAGADGPTYDHSEQLDHIMDNLDALTAAAAPMISDRPFGGVETLTWCGARLTGRSGDFQLEYSSRSRPDLIIVRFEHSQPVAIEVER